MKCLLWKFFTVIVYLSIWADGKHNIILILSDDQDVVLGGFMPMVKSQRLLSSAGATFVNSFATTPICCPSRSSILTGMYMHNHGTVNNSISGGCYSSSWQATHELRTFGVIAQSAGYNTFYAGKYLNQYGPKQVPPGWDWWFGLIGNSRYYNYSLSINGTRHHFSNTYLTDNLKLFALKFLKHSRAANSNFLMVVAPPAPHAPFTPTNKYKDKFKDLEVMKTKHFNVTSDRKHWLLRMSPSPLPASILPTLNEIYHRRWETLLSVDDLVESIILQLETTGLLENTYILYSSDHGFHMGQFGLPWDKRQPYEFDIRVPLIVRGPNISKKQLIHYPVLNIDLAPTILDMAGIDIPEYMDGESFLSVMTGSEPETGRTFLIEYEGEGSNETVSKKCNLPLDATLSECIPEGCCKCQDSRNNSYSCVRRLDSKENFIFCHFRDAENFTEAYDLNTDPYQLENIAPSLNLAMEEKYSRLLCQLESCKQKHCRINVH